MIGSAVTEQRGKIEINPISTANGNGRFLPFMARTEFSYTFFGNSGIREWQYGSGITAM